MLEVGMYKKVLVPLDGSLLAECALPHLINLAKEGSIGDAILLRIVEKDLPNYDPSYVITPNIDYAAWKKSLLEEAQKYLADVKSRLISEGVNAEAMVIEHNSPAQGIIVFSQQYGVDLIILGSHGYTGMKKLMFGSVALKVLHESHAPVLLIRPEG